MLSLDERCANTLDTVSQEALRTALQEHARASKAPYRQYEGHFDTWILCLVTAYTRFKGYSELPEGRIVLAAPEASLSPGVPASRSTYCTETGSIVGTPHENIRPLT